MNRLLSSKKADWVQFLYLFTRGILKDFSDDIQAVIDGSRCIIIDDTPIRKSGKHIEGTSYVYNHSENQKVLGYKMLSACYNDGSLTYPLLYSLHSKGKAP
jgi:hypothetical protein